MKIICLLGPFNGLTAEIPTSDDSSVAYKLKLRDHEECYELGRSVFDGQPRLVYAPERKSEENFIPGVII